MTAAEQLIEKGRLQGQLEGKLEGKLEGRLQERRENLRLLLSGRFGALEEATLARIDRADGDQLSEWLKHAVTASSLESVFGTA